MRAEIYDARRRRQLAMWVIAERVFTSLGTLQRVEPDVSIAIWAAALRTIGCRSSITMAARATTILAGRRGGVVAGNRDIVSALAAAPWQRTDHAGVEYISITTARHDWLLPRHHALRREATVTTV